MGILALPAAGMTSLNLTTFNALAALFVVSSIIGSVSTAWQNVFVPYTMDKAAPITTALGTHHHELSEDDIIQLRNKREREGLKISVWGSNALYLGVTIFFCITIGLSYINADAQVNAGLYVTSASGAICIICALVGWRFLPVPNNKPMKQGQSFWLLPFSTCTSRLPCELSIDDNVSQKSLERSRKVPRSVQILDRIYHLPRFSPHYRNRHHEPIQLDCPSISGRIYSLDSSRIRNINDLGNHLFIPLSSIRTIPQTMGYCGIRPGSPHRNVVFDWNER